MSEYDREPYAGKGQSVWMWDEDHELLFALRRVEGRSTKVVLHRALELYAAQSVEWQQRPRRRQRVRQAA
jgi:hypothetical protein